MDLSTGINPVPYPVGNIKPEAWTRLPDTGALAALEAAARAYYGVPDAAAMVAAPGTQALIQLLPRLMPATRVAVLGPTYTEHAHCWRAAGHDVDTVPLDAAPPDGAGLAVAVHPNNPDGHVHDVERLLAWAAQGRHLVIDEAFTDTLPEQSAVRYTGPEGPIVLRSFGKFFGLAGLRLGFAITDPETAGGLAAALGPWSVPGPALEIGARTLADREWIAETRRRLAADAARLDAVMAPHTGPALGGTDLFRLYDMNGQDLHARLAGHGIWTRIFDDRPELIRLGLPPDDAAFQRLTAALG